MATVGSHHVLTSLSGAQRQGFSTVDLLITSGINPRLIEFPDTRINDNQMARLVQIIWQHLDDEFMGFTETPCKRGAFAFMVHTMRRCKNLREALRTGIRFYALLTEDIRTELLETDSQATLDIQFSKPVLDPDYFYQEFWMIIWHRLSCWLSGVRIPLKHTRFTQSRSVHSLELGHMFPCTHDYDQASNQLIFDIDYLSLPLVRDKAEVQQFLIHSPFNLLSIPGFERNLQSKVVGLLTPPAGHRLEFPSIKELASRLNLSPQTLHRRLLSESSSYQRIKDNMRRDLALTKLVKEGRPVSEVAELVGYSEARSFTRAFRSWTGLSPREYCRYL